MSTDSDRRGAAARLALDRLRDAQRLGPGRDRRESEKDRRDDAGASDADPGDRPRSDRRAGGSGHRSHGGAGARRGLRRPRPHARRKPLPGPGRTRSTATISTRWRRSTLPTRASSILPIGCGTPVPPPSVNRSHEPSRWPPTFAHRSPTSSIRGIRRWSMRR